MQKFFTNDLNTKFIKSLLSNTRLPLVPTVINGDYVVKGFIYIYNGYIAKCEESGVVGGTALLENQSIYREDAVIPNMNNTYTSRFASYDVETHRYLGRYLEYMRDTKQYDMLYMYNCFDKSSVRDCSISNSPSCCLNHVLPVVDNTKRVYEIPIRFNRVYTIYMDCSSEVMITSSFRNSLGRTSHSSGSYVDESLYDCYSRWGNLQFSNPVTYKVDLEKCSDIIKAKSVEKDLRMLIQLPKDCKSSVVVLSGDYTDAQSKKIMNAQRDMSFSSCYRPKLTLINDKETYAFSDTLMEHLLLGVITKYDEIDYNVEKTLAFVGEKTNLGYTDYLKYVVYRKTLSDKKVYPLDIDGNINHLSETSVVRGTGGTVVRGVNNEYNW